MQQAVFYAAMVWMTGLIGVALVVLLRTRSPATRILMLDTITMILVTLLVLDSINTGSYYYMDAALILALLSFVTTLAAARFYGEGNPFGMIEVLRIWVAGGLVVIGAAVMAIGIYGAVWLPDVYTRLYAASKAIFLGIFPVLGAAIVLGDDAIGSRAALIALFLLFTTPVSAHAIGRAAYLAGEDQMSPDALDESGRE